MIGVVESKFLLVTIICSITTLSVHTVKSIIKRRSLGSKLNTNALTRRAIIQDFKYCNKYYKLKVGSNVTQGDRVYCDKNKGDEENWVLCATLANATARSFLVFSVFRFARAENFRLGENRLLS